MTLRTAREIAVPFHIGPDGGVAAVTNDEDAAIQHIITIIRTIPSERVMLPEFGSPATELLFDVNDEILQAEMTTRLTHALAQYEPRVNILGVRPIASTDQQYGAVQFEVAFTVAPRRDVLVARVDLGGGLTDEQAF